MALQEKMPMPDPGPPDPSCRTQEIDEEEIQETLQRIWGFRRLRPLQREAIRAGLEHRDALVVLPTGGGKSLCYQLPPLLARRTDVVISPLISLMKDQVDSLAGCGYPAAALHSGLSHARKAEVFRGVRKHRYHLLFVSPERLLSPDFMSLLEDLDPGAFAIDEAHCISHWGHDFRPEYRQLSQLKERFAGISIHAFTATATPRVRRDIIEQLQLRDPNVLVGRFDRENLVYRIIPRLSTTPQVMEVLARHPGEAAIVYCMTRRQTETLAAALSRRGVRAEPYHAGLERDERTRIQDAFAREEVDVVVATVAFGMGIDRSNVRAVIHTHMPKSIEHYQQETGRAGRDGLPGECVLLYSPADPVRWEKVMARAGQEGEASPAAEAAQRRLLGHMRNLCQTARCRHRALVAYFGQEYDKENCGACDVCLGEVESMPDSTDTARKILSCVFHLRERFGVGYLAEVLHGALTERIRRYGHDRLTTHGILKQFPETVLRNLVHQLLELGLLRQTDSDRPVLQLTAKAAAVLRGEEEVRLLQPSFKKTPEDSGTKKSWKSVDRDLWETLRRLRLEIARERSVPAYVIFSDRSLREMAALRPTSLEAMSTVHGVGEKKLQDLAPRFLEAIRTCQAEGNGPQE